MRILKVILIIVLILAAIIVVGSFFLPKTYSVSRSVIINAPDTVVYNNVADFNRFLKWNPWYKMDPEAKIEVSGTPLDVGHQYTWNGEKSGQGQMRIVSLQPLRTVNIELKFIKPFESVADTQFDFVTEGAGMKVTWIMSGESNSVLEKWMGVFTGDMIAGDFDSGLQSLKELSENQK